MWWIENLWFLHHSKLPITSKSVPSHYYVKVYIIIIHNYDILKKKSFKTLLNNAIDGYIFLNVFE
jgi:hypothetical protein